MPKLEREPKVKELEKLYSEFRKLSFPRFPNDFPVFGDFIEWDANVAGIVTRYIEGTEKSIDTPLSIREILDNSASDKEFLEYKPSTEENAQRFKKLIFRKERLDEMVKLINEIQKLDEL
jgi:uncharacterized protein YozE (UPF0346 family)